MRTPQARYDPQGRRWAVCRCRIPCQSTAGGVLFRCRQPPPHRLQVVDLSILPTLRGGSSGADKAFFPAGREMPITNMVRFVNRRVIEAVRSPAATDSLRRTARYAPRAASEKGPTPAEREASPCAKPG